MSKINGFIGRRHLMRLFGISSIGIGGVTTFSHILEPIQKTAIADTQPEKFTPINANEALRRLLSGNQRFITQKRKYPHQSQARLQSVAKGQTPFASILGCADSRVPAEIIFDQGIGDLFVVRVAGNVASDMAIGNLEYSTLVLGSQLIVVLGHERCGAVAEAVKNEPLPGKIGLIVDGIKPALFNIKVPGNDNQNAIIANIKYQVEKLQQSPTLAKLIQEHKLKIVGAFYDLDTGKVQIIN
ncbi:carbonic anhydrase [Richelia sinica FACHB-800]|uniref:carbonic anhydrase n=1 Tax=Richelia sinica FACHB-800 TaxID=1357546 RepID=A0A975T6Y5_9NOST|nr:carbonic anhydrase [Richelia sinica]MBD2664644.1 carbonic anhydrase [Richelia sinica FACHB-800]QXE23269.1 carbonic anhydrase [Richelia sinica FACHB-800]